MLGNLEPEENVMEQNNDILSKLSNVIQTLGWEVDDEICVEVGGVAVTGTAPNPNANQKWAKPFGTVTYQKDAFIVIKNRSRKPFEPSIAPES